MYLRRFADSDKRLVLVDRDDLSRAEVTTAKHALNLDDFYGWHTGLGPEDVDDPAVLDAEHIEKLLGVFESRAQGAFDRLVESGRPPRTAKDKYNLSNFIALQAARGQRFRDDQSQLATFLMRKHMRAETRPEQVRQWLAERGDPHEPDDVAAFIDSAYGPDGPRLVPDQALAIQNALRFAVQQVLPSLWERSWLVLTFDEPCLLTSDEPIVAFDPGGEPVTALTAPLLFMAVGRRHLLVLRQPSDTEVRAQAVTDASGRGNSEQAKRFNALVATQAERHVVHHPDDAALVADLMIGPRTRWGEEIVELIEDGDSVTVRSRLRRLPVE